MKEYLKMADVFENGVDDLSFELCHAEDPNTVLADFYSRTDCSYAAHAINSHDELVAEVKKLRSELSDAWFMVDEIKLSLDRRSRQAEYWESIAKE